MRRWQLAFALALVVVAVVVSLALGGRAGAPRSLAWKDLSAQVAPVEFGGPEQRRFRKAADFTKFLRLVETGPVFRIPHVDFTRDEVALFAVGPRSSAGYSLTVRGVSAEHGKTVVTVDEHSPELSSRAVARLTFPFLLISFPRSGRPLKINWPQAP